jgi:glycosyltransferase involved in cell wall biosynthesis
MRQPELTVIMAVHNGMPYLPEAVDSVLRQTFTDFRLIVVDDASRDGSAAYLKSLDDPRLQIIHQPWQGGQGAARNAALAQCDTDLIAFADADDVCCPERFERQVSYLKGHAEIGLLGTRVAYLGRDGRTGFAPPLAREHASIRTDLLAGRHALVNATLMFRRSVLLQAGVFRIGGAGEDWDFFLRMTEVSKAENLQEVLYLYRLHEASTNAVKARELQLRYAHACDAARRRQAGQKEEAFESFKQRQQDRSTVARAVELLDVYSGTLYRRGITAVLHGQNVAGYSQLVLAALLSPKRLTQRLQRGLRSRQFTPPAAGSPDIRRSR